jgi:hypothetical protein
MILSEKAATFPCGKSVRYASTSLNKRFGENLAREMKRSSRFGRFDRVEEILDRFSGVCAHSAQLMRRDAWGPCLIRKFGRARTGAQNLAIATLG